MYELVILGFLMRCPMHGYLMAKILNDMIGPYAKVSNGRLYPLLTKLEASGLIAVAEDMPDDQRTDRRQRRFQITSAGRKRFHQLMMDTASNPGDYQNVFWLKVPYFEFLRPEERLYLIDHFLTYCQSHIFHLTGEIDDLAQEPHHLTSTQLDASITAMTHYRSRWQLELEHAQHLREREVARESHEDAPAPLRLPLA